MANLLFRYIGESIQVIGYTKSEPTSTIKTDFIDAQSCPLRRLVERANNGHDIPFSNGQNFGILEGRSLIFHICS